MSKKQLSFETDLIKKVLKCNYDTASLDGRRVQAKGLYSIQITYDVFKNENNNFKYTQLFYSLNTRTFNLSFVAVKQKTQ